MKSSKAKITGWVLTALLALMLIGASASGKFTEWEGKAEMFQKMGFTEQVMFKIGILEVIITILFIIPHTAFIGAILLTGYLGGAIVTHIRVGDAFVFPIILGIIIWIALGLRNPAIFCLAMGGSGTTCPTKGDAANPPAT